MNEVHHCCYECGVTANVLTCIKKYGKPPKKIKSTVSTFHKGKCDYCGEEKAVTEARDFYYPDFTLIEKYARILL